MRSTLPTSANKMKKNPHSHPLTTAAGPGNGGRKGGPRESGLGPNGPSTNGGGGSTSGTGGDGGFRGKKVTTCSFCGKTSREVGPMVEGPNDVYICANCTDLCQNIFKQEKRRVTGAAPALTQIPSPRQMKRMCVVSSWMYCCSGCFRPPCGGTFATVPSSIFNKDC